MSVDGLLLLALFARPMPSDITHTSLILSIAAIIVSVASAVAAYGRWFVTHGQIRTQNLMQVSSLLHQSEFREARHALQQGPLEEVDFEVVRTVCSSFDFAALFIKNGLIKKEMFVQYWRPMLAHLQVHLSALRKRPVLGETTLEEYYEHLFWLLGELQSAPTLRK